MCYTKEKGYLGSVRDILEARENERRTKEQTESQKQKYKQQQEFYQKKQKQQQEFKNPLDFLNQFEQQVDKEESAEETKKTVIDLMKIAQQLFQEENLPNELVNDEEARIEIEIQ